MAVSKTMRFSILKRDGFACRYCKTKDGTLTVDHVLPVSLGGTDDPENLVAACEPCNQGKGSTPLDAEHVADIDEDALRWSAAIHEARGRLETETETKNKIRGRLFALWMDLTPSYAKDTVLPSDWAESVALFMKLGMSEELLTEATYIANAREGVPARSKFKYFCGVCRNMIKEIEHNAREIITKQEGDSGS